MSFKSCAYHITAPKGKDFTDEAEYNQALADGWVEAPWLVANPVPEENVNLEKIGSKIAEIDTEISNLEKKAKKPYSPARIKGKRTTRPRKSSKPKDKKWQQSEPPET